VTVALIFLPLAAAVLVGMLPLERRATEGIALLAAMVELALGLVALIRFDIHAGVQFATDRVITHNLAGIADVHFSVGMNGLSLFMVLLTAVGMMSAISAAMWAGRENPRFYFALLLVLEAALVLLFTSRDLVLFYIGWEVMIIPLYILMGVWGGSGRRAATLQFVVFTLIGSLTMLVAIAALGVEGHSFELTTLAAQGRDSVWLFFAFCLAFCVKAPMFPLHGWLPAAYRESTPEVTGLLSGVVSKAGAYGLLAFAIPLFPATAHDWRWLFLGLALVGLLYGSLVAFRQPTARGVVSFSSLAQMNLIIIGIFALNSDGRTGAIFQMVNHGVVSLAAFLLVGLVELRAGTDSFARLKGLANSRPIFSTVLLMAALWTLAVPGSSAFVSELYVLIGAFRQNAWLGAVAATAIVLAAMYALRWLAGIAYEDEGEAVAKDTPDLRIGELGIAVPLLLILLVMTAWPNGVMERIVG
jgi:NADH-quinone oxidoreductase subunit M